MGSWMPQSLSCSTSKDSLKGEGTKLGNYNFPPPSFLSRVHMYRQEGEGEEVGHMCNSLLSACLPRSATSEGRKHTHM